MSQPPRLHQPGPESGRSHNHIKGAIAEYINSLKEDGMPVPEDRLEAAVLVV